ncbi:MAG TPA: tetratricopeptide repeat protein [Frankiaceae bacterium]|nr:tetratricopeptide repeat protein [Frankiaceae bacterium]
MRQAVVVLVTLLLPAASVAQGVIQSPALRRAVAAYEAVDFAQVIVQARAALRERLTAPERARAEELLGFAFSATNQPDSAIAAFREAIQLDPDRQLDPRRISPRITGYFNAALGQVLVVRQLKVDTARFVSGTAGAGIPIRFTITTPARVRTRAVSGANTLLIDSGVVVGTYNLRWPATRAGGDPVPPGTWRILVEAFGSGQYTTSAYQDVQITAGAVDTLPHLTALPGYSELPETEIPPQSGRPLGIALLYTGVAGAGALALNNGDLGTATGREIGVAAGAALITGFVMMLRKPAPRPALGNIQYNRLLKEQLARRNADIALQNAQLRRQVQLTAVPIPKVAR